MNKKLINPRYIAVTFLGIGLTLIIASIYSNLPLILLIGFATLFWSFILFYVRPTKYVKITLFNIAAESIAINIEHLIKDGKFSEKGIYLSPKKLKNSEASVVFIPKSAETSLSEITEINDALLPEPKSYGGLFLTPPGYYLSLLFEREMKVSFIKRDLTYLEENISNLLIQKLELAQKVEVQHNGSEVRISLTNCVLEEACEATKKFPMVHEQIGCMLSSALACTIAKCSGKSVVIANENTTPRNMVIELLILDE